MIELKLDYPDMHRFRHEICQGMRARKIGRDAVEVNNSAGVAFAFGWLDKLLSDLVDAMEPEVTEGLTGNETGKP